MDTQVVEPTDQEFVAATETFKLLADETRLRIVWALLHGEHSVGELARHVGANLPAVSQQLAKLRAAHLVSVRRDGNRLFYAAINDHILRIVEQGLFHADHVVGDTPEHTPEHHAPAASHRPAKGERSA